MSQPDLLPKRERDGVLSLDRNSIPPTLVPPSLASIEFVLNVFSKINAQVVKQELLQLPSYTFTMA